jgi:hypothetical protein
VYSSSNPVPPKSFNILVIILPIVISCFVLVILGVVVAVAISVHIKKKREVNVPVEMAVPASTSFILIPDPTTNPMTDCGSAPPTVVIPDGSKQPLENTVAVPVWLSTGEVLQLPVSVHQIAVGPPPSVGSIEPFSQ